MNDQQLRLFEGADVEVCRLTVTGSTDSTQDDIDLPTGWKLGESVSFLARGIITKVTHVRTGNGLERQHVVVIDSMSFDEAPPSADYSVTITAEGLAALSADPPPASPASPGEGEPASVEEVNVVSDSDQGSPPVAVLPPWPRYEANHVALICRRIAGLSAEQVERVNAWEVAHQDRSEIVQTCARRLDDVTT